MILTLISPTGERWTLDPLPWNGNALADWMRGLPVDQERAAQAITKILSHPHSPPPGKALVARTKSGWQAILSNP